MKAAVWKGVNHVEIEEIPMPKPKVGEALIRVKSAGLCMTDVHIIQGSFNYTTPPHVLGHEISGVVENDAGQFKKGDRVVVGTVMSCSKCRFCLSGLRYLCENGGEIGFAPFQGGYAEYLSVPPENLYHLPESLSFNEGGIFESFVCCFGSLQACGNILGKTVLIFGAGPAGLSFIITAKAAGAGKIILAARNPARLKQAEEFGADVIIDIEKQDVHSAVANITSGFGADLTIEAAGVPKSTADSITCASKAGTVLFYGIPSGNIPLPVSDIVTKKLTILGLMGNPDSYQAGLDLLSSGRASIKNMITHTFSLENFNDAFDLVANKRDSVIKAVINP